MIYEVDSPLFRSFLSQKGGASDERYEDIFRYKTRARRLSEPSQQAQPSDQDAEQVQLAQQPSHSDISIPDLEPPSSPQPLRSRKVLRRTRGPTRNLSILNRPPGTKIQVEFGPEHQPTGENASKFSNFLAGLAKNGELLPINCDDWRAMSDDSKEAVLLIIQDTFDIPEYTKDWVLMSIGKHWRNWKHYLKKKFYTPYQTLEERITACIDARVKSDQWEALVNWWGSPEGMARSVTNTANRKQLEFTHTAGSRPFSRIRGDLRRTEGREPSRTRMFLATHTNKAGQPMDEGVAAIFEKLQECASQLPEDTPDAPARDDTFSQVMGEDRRGRVRTYGFGPSPSHILGAAPSRTNALRMVTESSQEVQHMRKEMDEMRAMMETMRANMEALRRGFHGEAEPSVPAIEAPDDGSCHATSQRIPSSSGSHTLPDPETASPRVKRAKVQNACEPKFVILKSTGKKTAIAKDALTIMKPKK